MTGSGNGEADTPDRTGPDDGRRAGAEETPARPFLRIVKGAPDDAELVALTVVLAAAASVPATEEPRVPNAWVDRGDLLRGPLPVGPGAWRMSTWPR